MTSKLVVLWAARAFRQASSFTKSRPAWTGGIVGQSIVWAEARAAEIARSAVVFTRAKDNYGRRRTRMNTDKKMPWSICVHLCPSVAKNLEVQPQHELQDPAAGLDGAADIAVCAGHLAEGCTSIGVGSTVTK